MWTPFVATTIREQITQVITTQNTDVNIHTAHLLSLHSVEHHVYTLCCPCTPWNTTGHFYHSASFKFLSQNFYVNVISNLASPENIFFHELKW